MSRDDLETDGGVTQESIFGTGEDERRSRSSPKERFGRGFDSYVRTPFRIAWNDWRTRIGGIGILIYLLMGTVGVIIVPAPTLNEGPRYLQPFQDWTIPFGTDNLGRGIFKQLIHSTPAMLKMALAGLVFAVGVAILFGMIAGYKGGVIDTVLMTITDIFFVIPGLPLIIVLSAIFTPRDPFIVGAILSISVWPRLARELRSQVLSLRTEDYVEASRSMGLSTPTIIGQELMPKLAPYILIRGSGSAVRIIRDSVALYFLGILPFSTTNWGIMMQFAYSQGNAISTPSHLYWLVVPLVALAGMGFSLILFSQGLDRVFNPRLRARNTEHGADEDGTGVM
ncbi:ABC transporter permease [Halobacteria archaeon HArc-gm2]|nr:ABC transporter permease [Halobacteria archaeon HArc-gm2]